MAKKYTAEQIDFLAQNIAGCPFKELTEKFNAQFGLKLKVSTLSSLAARNGLRNGRDVRMDLASLGVKNRFKPGQVPHNKGKKGINHEGSQATQFKKGQMPHNYKPVGTERIIDDYVQIKVADPKKWKSKHALIWEEANGPLPKGHVVIFGDGNNRNFDLDNLLLVSRSQLARLNQNNLIMDDADLTRTGIVIADLKTQISRRTKKAKKR